MVPVRRPGHPSWGCARLLASKKRCRCDGVTVAFPRRRKPDCPTNRASVARAENDYSKLTPSSSTTTTPRADALSSLAGLSPGGGANAANGSPPPVAGLASTITINKFDPGLSPSSSPARGDEILSVGRPSCQQQPFALLAPELGGAGHETARGRSQGPGAG